MWVLFAAFSLMGCGAADESNKESTKEGGGHRVVRLADGDTFTLLLPGNQQQRVRLHGIDAPERGQDFGNVARSKMEDLTTGHRIRIEEKDRDRYGRVVAIAWRDDGLNLNEEMLRTGYAWHYTQYDKNPEWKTLAQQAKKKRLGLWAGANPTPPWEWRKIKRKPKAT